MFQQRSRPNRHQFDALPTLTFERRQLIEADRKYLGFGLIQSSVAQLPTEQQGLPHRHDKKHTPQGSRLYYEQ